MTVTDHIFFLKIAVISVFSYGHLNDFLKSDFLFHIHFSVVICDLLVISSQITFVPMHVPFKIHYRNNLIDKKDFYLIPDSTSAILGDRNCSYGHQLYPSDIVFLLFYVILIFMSLSPPRIVFVLSCLSVRPSVGHTACQRNSSETTEQNFMKLGRQ